MDARTADQIISELHTLSMGDLYRLSEAVQNEMNPSFEKLSEWENQKLDRAFKWVVNSFKFTYYTALVLFHDGQIKLYKGSSTDELTSKRIALRSALCDMTMLDVEENLDRVPTLRSSDDDDDEIPAPMIKRNNGTKNFSSNSVSRYNRDFPHMKWDEEKKIYTDGEFVYTSLEKVYARLLKNGKLRPLSDFETTVLSNRDIQHVKIDNMKDIYALRDVQYRESSSKEDSLSEMLSEEEDEEEPVFKAVGKNKWKYFHNMGQVRWCPKYKLYTDGKFVYSSSKKAFGKRRADSMDIMWVDPLDIADVRTLKEAKIEMVGNFHSNKISTHIKESRLSHEFEFEAKSGPESSSSEAEEVVYPEDNMDGCC